MPSQRHTADYESLSTDTIAYFGVAEGFDGPRWLYDRLCERPRWLVPVVKTYGHLWRIKKWSLGRHDPDRCAELVGPGGLSLTVGKRLMRAYHMIRFGRFAGDPGLRAVVRNAFFELANLVGSSRAIYIHEMAGPRVDQFTADLTDAEASLREQFESPSASFDQLAAAEFWQAGCWLIDEFADLRAVTPPGESR